MFEIGFWELTIIGIVALLVIGPERLPKLAHTAGLWVGRVQRFVNSVKTDIAREVKAEELKRVMKEHADSSGIHDIMEETRDTLDKFREPEYLVKSAKPEPGSHAATDAGDQKPGTGESLTAAAEPEQKQARTD